MGLRGPKPRREEVVWTSDFAYAIGLIASDGCLSPDGRHFTFVSKDKEQVLNIKKCLSISANPSCRASGVGGDKNYYYRLQWGDIYLYNFLLSLGLTHNKSLSLGEIKVPDKYFFDFVRGSFDGDGCFYSYFDPRWKSSFMFYVTFTSGSHKHTEWLQKRLEGLCGIKGHITRNSKSKHITNLKYAKRESLVLLKLLYSSPSVTHLSRKRLKIESALSIVGMSLTVT